jgi:hypothetical protein
MKNQAAQVALTFGVALLAMPALAQTQESFTNSTPAPVAYVYIQTNPGVVAYAAAANGTLTLVKGSPFPVSGQMEDIGGKFLISVGTTILHVYQIESEGGVGKQISQINTASYGGSECGATSGQGSVLDHTGKYLYVRLFNTGGDCSSWQTYEVESDGHLQFEGDVDSDNYDYYGAVQSTTVPTVSSSDKFLYGSVPYWDDKGLFAPSFAAFTKSSNGVLEVNGAFSETDPAPYGDYYFYPMAAQADPYGHLAVLMSAVDEPGGSYFGQPWLASYTINPSTGAVVSTNTESDMPHTAGDAGNSNLRDKLSMSPAGNLVAVAEYPGIQIFHFNGAAPITFFSGQQPLDPSADFDRLAWDGHDHLYALSFSSNQLHVLTVTPTTIAEVPGSPYNLPKSPYGTKGIVVVSK